MTEEELMDKSFDDLIEYEDNLKKEWEKAKKELKDIVHSKYFDFVEDNETYSSEGLVNIEKTDDKVHGYPKGECCKIKGEYKLYLKTKMYLETLERVLARTDNLFLDQESGAVPYLPLAPTGR